jgi:RNA polymerase sigma factor (sigma-70 family)
VISRIMADRVRACLHLLSEGELALIVKRYYEDRSQSDVAAELNLNQSNVCRKEERILAKLRNLLEK